MMLASPTVAAPAFAGRNIANIKAHNLQAVLLTLLHQGPLSRARMAELTGLSTTTITNLMSELLAQGIVAEEGREPYSPHGERHGAGRPRIPVSLVPSARYVVGIHFDVDNVRVALADLAGHLCPCYIAPQEGRVEAVLDRAAGLVETALAESGIPPDRVLGVGVGASGLVDPDTGVNLLSPSLGWRDVPIRDVLARRLGLPVLVENNVRAMALAEAMFGAGRARGVDSLAFVYARVGVGAGLIVGGRVFRGSFGGAGEIGHMTMIPIGGAACRCGNHGCLETLVSEPAIVARAARLAADDPSSLLAVRPDEAGTPAIDQVFAAARAGDEPTRAMLAECGLYMGTALANLVNVVNPDMIILGGLLAAGQDLLLPSIEIALRERAFAGLGRRVELRTATFGVNSGVLGAAALALDELFYRQAMPALGSRKEQEGGQSQQLV